MDKLTWVKMVWFFILTIIYLYVVKYTQYEVGYKIIAEKILCIFERIHWIEYINYRYTG